MTSSFAFGPALVVMIAATFVLAGMVKGVTGMGLPTVAMGILGSLISPVAAAAMLLLPSLMSNLFQFGGGGNTRQLLKRLWPMLLTVVVATLLASAWITGGDTTRTQFALGVALVAYAIWTLAGKKIAVAPQREKPYSLVIGFVTGLLTGGTGVFVMPAVLYVCEPVFSKTTLHWRTPAPKKESKTAKALKAASGKLPARKDKAQPEADMSQPDAAPASQTEEPSEEQETANV